MSRGLKKQESLLHVLRVTLELACERQEVLKQEDDFDLPVEPPAITGEERGEWGCGDGR